jgi:hypothetical protein
MAIFSGPGMQMSIDPPDPQKETLMYPANA